MSRPYTNLAIEDLERLAARGSVDELREVQRELAHRSSHRARTLAASVDRRLVSGGSKPSRSARTTPAPRAGAAKTPAAVAKKDAAKKSGAPATTDVANPGRSPRRADATSEPIELPSANCDDRYEALRATFTLEAETLARWGMTGAIPAEIEQVVFDAWRARLTETPDRYGRSRQRLQRDLDRLELERRVE